MATFSELFGKDRDIVNETGATAGQKLRVTSDGQELESFDLAVETVAGSSGLQPTTTTTSGTFVPSAQFTFTSFASGTDGFITGADFSAFSSGDAVRVSGTGGTIDIEFGTIGAAGAGPIGSTQVNFNHLSGVDYSTAPAISAPTFTLLQSVVTAGVTTVTGDLKVTGLEAGNVVSDADGNLSISAAVAVEYQELLIEYLYSIVLVTV